MSFHEFLKAMGRGKLVELLQQSAWEDINALSSLFSDLLRQYYYVGGMPAVVNAYINRKNLQEVRTLQQMILNDYEADFSKHAPAREIPRIRMVWQGIPSQLAKENKKFIYGVMKKGARAASFELAIQWLVDAGLVYRVDKVNAVKMPAKFYEDFGAFKLFVLDIGLMGAMVDAPASAVMLGNNIFSEYKGAFTELYVCTQLQNSEVPAYYHSVEGSRIEIDFVVQMGTAVYPIEVKAEENLQSKSLKTFVGNHPELKGIRLSMRPYIDQGWMENIPLYAFREVFKKRMEEQA